MKKILLLASAAGEGEDAAARNLKIAVELVGGSNVRVQLIDLLEGSPGYFAGLFSRLSKGGIAGSPENLREELWDALRSFEPDVVVYFAPVYGFLLDEIHRAGRARDFRTIALATELAFEPSAWASTHADMVVVAQDAARRALADLGRPANEIEVLAYPTRAHEPAKTREVKTPEFGRILYLINCARKKAPKLLDRLLSEYDGHITVCLDDAEEIADAISARADAAPGRVEVITAVRDLPRLLREHDLVITRPSTDIVQEAIAARCPIIVPKRGSGREEANLRVLQNVHAGALAEKPREVAAWVKRALREEGKLAALWRRNLASLGREEGGARELARFVLAEADRIDGGANVTLRSLPAPSLLRAGAGKMPGPATRGPRPEKRLLLCDLHAHTTWSDGKLSVREIVDFYGQRGFDCLCLTDHLCDPARLLGRLVNLTGLVIPPDEVGDYFTAIEREKKRAWAKYDLLLMTGLEFNKDGYTPKTSAHLLGIDLQKPINPSLGIEETIREIHAQGALAIASHPHETKSHWGKDTLYFWEHVDEFAPLLDAWEVANRDDIFNPVGLKKLPFIASSDFHKPKHIHSWKTLLYCEKEAEAIKHCIRVNRDVSLTLYRDHRFGMEEEEAAERGNHVTLNSGTS